MMKPLKIGMLLLTGLLSLQVSAHESWILASPFNLSKQKETRISLRVGVDFTGEERSFSRSKISSLNLYSKDSVQNLVPKILEGTEVPELLVTIDKPGTHLIAYDSSAHEITLEAEKFNSYLADEGLNSVIQQRQKDKTDSKPARERYRRNAKVIIQSGKKSDETFQTRTHQRLEIVPLTQPKNLKLTQPFKVQLYFEDKPLEGILVKAWHKRNNQTVIIKTRTDGDGKASFDLPFHGSWMVSAVHMIAVNDSPQFDWDSFWGNLSFEI